MLRMPDNLSTGEDHNVPTDFAENPKKERQRANESTTEQLANRERGSPPCRNNSGIGKVDKRTNLYFVQTDDRGKTWCCANGKIIETPITDPASAALVHDYRADKRLVYMKDIGFDAKNNPVILYITSAHHQPGPQGDPRMWTIAHWSGDTWNLSEVTTSTHNYDMGSLYIEEDRLWKIIAPTEPGPQKYGSGGEIAIWTSRNQGQTWKKNRDITRNSMRNYSYVRRPVHAQPDFYGFWADGNPEAMSESRLYFTDKSGSRVWRLPYNMENSTALPTILDQKK